MVVQQVVKNTSKNVLKKSVKQKAIIKAVKERVVTPLSSENLRKRVSSVVRLDRRLATVRTSRMVRIYGNLDVEELKKVDKAISTIEKEMIDYTMKNLGKDATLVDFLEKYNTDKKFRKGIEKRISALIEKNKEVKEGLEILAHKLGIKYEKVTDLTETATNYAIARWYVMGGNKIEKIRKHVARIDKHSRSFSVLARFTVLPAYLVLEMLGLGYFTMPLMYLTDYYPAGVVEGMREQAEKEKLAQLQQVLKERVKIMGAEGL